ncbi:ribonuclease HII [Shumkonia mesophila]|uniref:ribonuclease HII n=1 Tax=Shumkonia mesophila TaxID=2838854 RepID=UPI0029346CB1|nr:ribonuclease HII [Shumkonia mesophila]
MTPRQPLLWPDAPLRPDFSLEDAAIRQGHAIIAGIDEAGRGPWAGPVVAAAVILNRALLPTEIAEAINDSKKLTATQRESLFAVLPAFAAIGVGQAHVEEIDRNNILNATLTAMSHALDALPVLPDIALIDGNRMPDLACKGRCVVRGDARSLSIAAASIVAKVTRDRIMAKLAIVHPGYGWEHNAGYGTAEHRAGLERLGVTPEHRKSFAPVIKMLRPVDA